MIAAVETAMLAALASAAQAGTLGYDYPTLDSFPDEFEEYLVEQAKLRTPGAWAVFLGLAQGEDNGDDSGWHGRARFALVVAAQNLRNEKQTRHGDGAQPGSYQLAEDAIRILSRSDLGLDLVAPMLPISMRPIARSQAIKRLGLSLMAIEFECTLPVGLFDADTGTFSSLHVDWDVPPFGNVLPDPELPLPAPNPDAEDLIEVPQ